MAQDKEAFLSRWSRRKLEDREENKDLAKPAAPAPALPPAESLTPESDEFKSFMHPKVKDALRRAALKKLFSDPHFNVPDAFEPFSDDWTVGEPIPPELLAGLNQAKEVLFREEEEEKRRLAEAQAKAEQESEQEPIAQNPDTDEPGRQDT